MQTPLIPAGKMIIIAGLTFISGIVMAQQRSENPFHILHPVPSGQLREMETDRPDLTESAFTVDAGHLQYETDLIRLERQKTDNGSSRTLLVNQFLLKAGLTRATELQFGFQSYVWQRNRESADVSHTHGTGDLTLRLKQNLCGNDAGNFIMAILPYMRFPSSRFEQSRYEYGLLLPMQAKLPGDWKLGFQVEADRLKDETANGMHTELSQSLTISHELLKHLDGIAETYYTYDFKGHQLSNFLNAALQLEVTKGVKIDGGINYGFQHEARKSYFLGSSFRF